MSSLPTPLRRQLESAIKQARKIATSGAHKALEALAVHEPDPYRHMDAAQRDLRRQLRAQAKQLGDCESQSRRGAYEIRHLVEKLAYDQWHRLLFAQYLLENNLLISPEHEVAVSLDDCEELAPSLGLKDAWEVAARFAAKELPEIFRADDPAGQVDLPLEDRKPLVQLVTGLPVDVFTASDSLGWCYQFWQAERRDEVNASGNKIGADELPAVTQLFTEDYMVDFLLDNTLGAWWGGKRLEEDGGRTTFSNEHEARDFVALPDCPWTYLRFIKAEEGTPAGDSASTSIPTWRPAAGTFDGWPKTAAALTCLDPCMGSGHFIVALFERLVALRIAEESLDEAEAVAAVICDNLFGLEIDPRCTQIAAFNLAMAAWRRVGYCPLPPMNLACSGLAPNASEDDWLSIAGSNEKLRNGMLQLYRLFENAPVLGSLSNPRLSADDMYSAGYHELRPLLEQALAKETDDDRMHEIAVTARGLAMAAAILASEFTLVTTNVPYLGQKKQNDVLAGYANRVYADAKPDLATCFIERCLLLCGERANSVALVAPQNWLFLSSYKKLRQNLLRKISWNVIARLGPKGFQTVMWDFNTGLFIFTSRRPKDKHSIVGIDVSAMSTPTEKSLALVRDTISETFQLAQMSNPDFVITSVAIKTGSLLSEYATAFEGAKTVDIIRFRRLFWEISTILDDRWWFHSSSPSGQTPYSGCEYLSANRSPGGTFDTNIAAYENCGIKVVGWECGKPCWKRKGISIAWMAQLPASLYVGSVFDNSAAVILPKHESDLRAIYCYITSGEYLVEIRKINQKVQVAAGTLDKVPFDLAHWTKVAEERFPHGLPKPFSSNPTQWLFNGHSQGSDQPLHIAVARLLGYRWPRQTGSSFPDCPALGPDGLESLADPDGIVCLSASKGEAPAAERLRGLLVQALEEFDIPALLDSAGPKGSKSKTIDEWLRDEFFEQHCALFHHRPFVWHIWDGHMSGFSALVNYHRLDHANLEKLTYAYLGDWIRRQQSAVEAGEAGSDARLQSAKLLQARLKLILEGEPPFDIFVRWKPLSQQPIGWHPDPNDGVRLNIRPFLAQDLPGGKKGAGILRTKPNIKWDKDRGKEPRRDKAEFPWFYNGSNFTGDRLNDIHLTREQKEEA